MAQFGTGKALPPWQRQQPQQQPAIQTSILGQHASTAGTPQGIPGQQLVIGGAPQQPQYAPVQHAPVQHAPVQHAPVQHAPVQQSMIQPPGLGGLQTIAQTTIPQVQPSMAQPTLPQPNVVQGVANNPTIMGQPPLTSQPIQPPTIVNQTQIAPSQIPQIQPQVTTVSYPAPRPLAPPAGPYNSPVVAQIQSNTPPSQQPQKQRVFTGNITKLCADFGFVDEDVFFQTSCVKGNTPKVGDRVLVEATFNPNMPFKWNANRVQVIPGLGGPPQGPGPQNNSRQSQNQRDLRESLNSRSGSYNAVPPPIFAGGEVPPPNINSGRSGQHNRSRSPRRDRREERNHPREREREREEKEKEPKRETRKRSRSRDRTRSPPRRRPRIVPRYNVQVPKLLLHVKEVNVLELRKRYSNLYVPSDVFLSRPLWSDTFPASRAFAFPRPVSFHIMSKEVDAVLENDAIYDPPDVNYGYAAKVMLMSMPALEDLYRRSCALSEDPSDVRECFVHPTRLINFLVGLKGKNETMAIGGYWSPSLDGPNPEKDPNVLIKTAIRTCMALTGINLSGCMTWYRFAEIYYRRGESTHKGRVSPARVETTVIFLPDVWNTCPTKLEWDGLQLNYKRQLERKLSSSYGSTAPPQTPTEELEEDGDDKDGGRKDPSHWSLLDPRNMKVVDLRTELDARLINSKGLKSQLIARLTKVIKTEQEKEESEKTIKVEKTDVDDVKRREEEERRKEEERKKREEEDKKKEEEERKKTEERERTLLEKRYTLPEQPMVAVHPSRTAKSGKFDCATMSLSVLLDYRQEDNKEHSFEVSLFAEMFNEMLMRDFAFRIYKAICEAPDTVKEHKKEKDSKDKDSKEKKEDKKETKDEKDKKEEKDDDDTKDDKKDKDDDNLLMNDDEMNELLDFFEEDDEDSKEDSRSEKDKKRDGNKRDRDSKDSKDKDSKKEKREKKKMCTVDPYLLLAFVYFDQTHTGYIIDRDLEDIINMLDLNLSRAQLKKLLLKVISRDAVYYRKLTDVPIDDKDKARESLPAHEVEILARGNNLVLPQFFDVRDSGKKGKLTKSEIKMEAAEGKQSLVNIDKLMQQLNRSEKARSDTEEKLRELQKELGESKEEARKSTDSSNKLGKDVKSLQLLLRTTEEELKKALEDNNIYQKAVNSIKNVIKPLVSISDMEEELLPTTEIKQENGDV